jgi:cytochrome P450
VTERDPVKYGQMRRLFSDAFSTKSLQEQEDIIHKYTNLLIRQLATGDKVNGENMVKWFNLITFDVIGDLGFGDPFGALEKGNYHFWINNLILSVRLISQMGTLRQYTLAKYLLPLLVPKGAMEKRAKQLQYSMDKVKRRQGMPNTRKDFLTKILAEREAQGITMQQLAAHSNTFVIAGSETSSTALSAMLYYLLKSPSQYKKLVDEVRSEFPRYEDITGTATDHMVYMKAVINEGLRIYPPSPNGLTRVSPGEFVDGIWIPEGVEVFTSMYATHRDPRNFTRADEFHPERWIDGHDEFADDNRSASQPFSLGPRGCIGRK